MKQLIILIALITMFTFTGCTENQRVKHWGATGKIDLPAGKKLVNITWKEDEVWYLTRQRKAQEDIESYEFSQKSSWGIIEGSYIINETK